MQTSEDRSIYDKVVNAIFDQDVSSIKDQHHHPGRFRLPESGASAIQYVDLNTWGAGLYYWNFKGGFQKALCKAFRNYSHVLFGWLPAVQ